MKALHFVYDEEEGQQEGQKAVKRGPKSTGCISKLVTYVKGCMVRVVNEAGKKTHGRSLRISDPNRKLGNGPKRRVPGVFEKGMVLSSAVEPTANADRAVDELGPTEVRQELWEARRQLEVSDNVIKKYKKVSRNR